MIGFKLALIEAFWSVLIKAELVYGRARRRVERWWVLRKKENTTWNDVWHYLDKVSGHTWADDHIDRLKWLSDKKNGAWLKKIDFKYSVKL